MALAKKDLKKYGDLVLGAGATTVKVISPISVVTAPWVRWKCQFGCGGYGHNYCCPPDTPTPEETRRVLDGYGRALLCHIETAATPDRRRLLKRFRQGLIALEGELFKDGYYKAFAFLAGPCNSCEACGKERGEPCADRFRARPSMEACGIDVYQTVRNNGLSIEPLKSKQEPRNTFCLLLVD
ncbi:MAG: DUF2284 domain-containing protein [Deltaproteobacteria bacterium]|nr:DUF2284 domain-containing protein [Deltaproteobacteria bacterium]